jgi:serine/threonine-protein kinase
MAKSKPWIEKWVERDLLSEGGGQGRIFLVERADGLGQGTHSVLKVLKRQEDAERRSRMHREVAALQSLDHPGVPKCLDSNAYRFRDTAIPLYIVTDYIPGPTLAEFAGDRLCDPKISIEFTLKLLEIINYCHNKLVIHRDIKPDNVILREGDPLRPVLIDFGLSFNEDDLADSVTGTGQELGNRFLHLPELQHPGPGQRDARSDLTQCCGLLLFLVSGHSPRTLRDKDGQKPHLRNEILKIINTLDKHWKETFYYIFEKGFEQEIDRRFQTADEMMLMLSGGSRGAGEPEERAAKVGMIRAAIGLDETLQRQKKHHFLLEECYQHIEATCREVSEHLFGSEAWSIVSNCNIDLQNLRLETMQGLYHRNMPDKAFKPRFLGSITESQFRLVAQEESGRSSTVFVSSIEGPTDWSRLKESLKSLYIDRVHDIYCGRDRNRLTLPLPVPRSTPFGYAELSDLLGQLPLRAIVAFAARCARRVQPVFNGRDPPPAPLDFVC